MSRIIRIEKCAECQFMNHEFWTDMPYCRKRPDLVLYDEEVIPDGCPLERAPETKGASDE